LPTWDDVRKASEAKIADTIKYGGLQNKKAHYIKGALEKIKADFGELSLDPLDEYSDNKALRYLESLPGISVKSARCILMYSLGRKLFPVDTHVWRVCRRLGLTPAVPKPTVVQQRDLEAQVPEEMRYGLHVNLVSHGREVCLTYWPKCDKCVLADICPSYEKPDEVWGKWRKPQGAWAQYASKKCE
jgi:endonuclease III